MIAALYFLSNEIETWNEPCAVKGGVVDQLQFFREIMMERMLRDVAMALTLF